MSSRNPYGITFVNYMLTKEQVFKQFRSCYYLLYQCLVPNTREALSLLVQHYSVPKDFERSILSGENPRVCNQGILNYLLIKLRSDKNFVKFWKVVKTMIKNPVLRRAVEKIQRGIHHPSIVSIQSIMHHHDTTLDTNSVCPLEQRALSVTDSDDDYCVSYIVAMVDVRSCTRPPRSHDQQHISEHPHVSMPPRSPNQTHINECTEQPKSLQPQSPTSVGFKILQSHYSVLVRSMPDDYMNTVSQLERHLTGDHIGSILECRDVFTGNQRILDCLIEQVNTKEGLLDFCEQLNSIANTPSLTAVIESVKRECIRLITSDADIQSNTTITTATTHTTNNTTIASVVTSSSVSVATPSTAQLTSNTVSRQSHYSVLVRSMPDDYMNTVSQLERHLTGDHIGSILECRDVFTANQRILDCLIEQINDQEGLLDFCDSLSIVNDGPEFITALGEFAGDVMAAVEVDDFSVSKSAANSFNVTVASIVHSNKLPDVADTDCIFELLEGFIHHGFIHYGPKGVATLRKHYNNLWMSLPENHMITLKRLLDIGKYKIPDEFVDQMRSSTNSRSSNKEILDRLICNTANDYQLLGLSFAIERLAIGEDKYPLYEASDYPNIKLFRKDCLQIIKEKISEEDNKNIKSSTSTGITDTATITTHGLAARPTYTSSVSQKSNVNAAVEKKLHSSRPCMKDLQNIITPKYAAQWMVIGTQLGIDYGTLQIIAANFPSDVVRCCNEMFQKWLESDCEATWNKIYSAVESPAVTKTKTKLGVPELRNQPSPICPANHVPRVELLKEISSAVLNSDITPTIGTTVTIRGIGGIGKSTIAKALCHDHLIKEHFVNGFLWITLTPPLPNPMTKLSEIYQKLTGKCATSNISVLQNEIKLLVSDPSCKLLVILDDVWEVKDAMMFVEVFSSCKIILTTRKMNINAKIPPIVCFDIQKMTIDESIKLLTLKIVDVEALDNTDTTKITELVRDLHCWPLLLSLVHCQLYFHCIEWNESPHDAILKVQQKLFDNGLTAFDPEDPPEASRENAVKASITASLELLTKDDIILLCCIASAIAGFGIYTVRDALPILVQMDSKQFDKCTGNLWCHGLISLHDVIFPNVTTKIPCIGMHDIISQYINENMSNDFYLSITIQGIQELDTFIHTYFSNNVSKNIGQLFLGQVDALRIPFFIRMLMIFTKIIQTSYLVEQNNENKSLIHSIQFPSLKNMHKTIEQDCRTIHSLLADGKHNEAITWAKQHFDNHPWKPTIEIGKKLDKDDDEAIESLSLVSEAIDQIKRYTVLHIYGYSHVLLLVNVGASHDDISHYLVCSGLYGNSGRLCCIFDN